MDRSTNPVQDRRTGLALLGTLATTAVACTALWMVAALFLMGMADFLGLLGHVRPTGGRLLVADAAVFAISFPLPLLLQRRMLQH